MELHRFATPELLIESLAAYVVDQINQVLSVKQRASVVLSGGNSPKQLYALLALKYANGIDWNRIDFFFGDERYVPVNDASYNGAMAHDSFFQPLQIPAGHIFYVNTNLPVDEAAANYYQRIQNYFGEAAIEFDVNLLGLGDNAHTASLFPHTAILSATESAVQPVFVKELNSWRISMTAAMINDSRLILFLVYGAAKAAAVQQVIEGPVNPVQYPAQLIQPAHGSLHWFVDDAAAAMLQ